MAVIQTYLGADFSGSDLPRLRRLRFGFAADDLQALYLLQDGVASQAYPASVIDSSGRGNNATLISGASAPQRSANGMSLPQGGGLLSPIAAKAPYTILVVARQTIGNMPRTDVPFPGFHAPSGGLNGYSYAGSGKSGLTLNLNLAGQTPGSLPLGLFGTGSPFAGSASLQGATPVPAVSEQSFFAAGYAVESLTDRLDFRTSAGASFRTNLKTVNDLARNATGTHAFGVFSTGNIPAGDLLLAAVYGRALTAAELDVELANAKRFCQLRSGISVV